MAGHRDAGQWRRYRLHDPAWLTRFHLYHRQAKHYRCGRIFLAGDAAHIHSHAGGQGMNTGIQDAWNLGWKLALVTRGVADDRLLDSYEAERWPIGRFLLYDLHNDLGLAAALGKRQGEKKLLFDQLWSYTEQGDVLVMDRAYTDYAIFAFALKQGREVVTRVPRRRFNAFEEFWKSDLREQLICLRAPASAREFVLAHQLPEEITLRLIRVVLESGETEVLATTLLDGEKYPACEFKQVYGWRWGQETFFDRFKNIFEVERFSGTTVTTIKQDFQGALFLGSKEMDLEVGIRITIERAHTRPEE